MASIYIGGNWEIRYFFFEKTLVDILIERKLARKNNVIKNFQPPADKRLLSPSPNGKISTRSFGFLATSSLRSRYKSSRGRQRESPTFPTCPLRTLPSTKKKLRNIL